MGGRMADKLKDLISFEGIGLSDEEVKNFEKGFYKYLGKKVTKLEDGGSDENKNS